MMNLLRNKRIWKRGLALLLSVMVLLSAVDMLMVSVMANDSQYTGDAYTITTNAVNFESNGEVVYIVQRKKPVYSYEFIYDENGIPVQVQKTLSNTWLDEYEYANCQPMMYNNTQVVDAQGNLVWEVVDNSAKTYSTAMSGNPSKFKIKTGEHTYVEEYCGFISREGSRRINVIRKDGDTWKEISLIRTSIYLEEKDENGDPILDENGDPILETSPTYVWEYEKDYVPAGATVNDASLDVAVPSDNTEHTYTVRLKSPTPVKVELSHQSGSYELLFMDREENLPDSVLPANPSVELDSNNDTSEFTVQFPEPQYKTLKKLWQDNGAQKTQALNIGVRYKDENDQDVVLIPASPAVDQSSPLKNNYEDAEFYRTSATFSTWTYTLEASYLYNSDGTQRNFELYEAEIPDGYIQQRDSNGNLVNIKTNPFEATITWHDADNKYGSRPDPEVLANNIKDLVYKKSAGGEGVKLDDVIVLCKGAYQPKKKKISPASYATLDSSVYLTSEEITAYNNEIVGKQNAVNTYISEISGYNAEVDTYSNDPEYPAALPDNFPYAAPKLSDFGGDKYLYNCAVDEYNDHVRDYNEGTDGVTQFNAKVDTDNALVDEYNAAIDSRLDNVNDLRNEENVVVITPGIDNKWTITMPHAMEVDGSNKNYSYYIKNTDNGKSLMDDLIPSSADANGIDHENDKYSASISNSGNNASFTDAIYNKAEVKATLTGETGFSVYKYWGDDDDGHRPQYEFEIYHYSDVDGKSYRTATAMPKDDLKRPVIDSSIGSRDAGITEYVFQKGDISQAVSAVPNQEQNAYAKYICNVNLSSIPKFDATGRMYIYYVKENSIKSSDIHSYATSRDSSHEDSPYKANEYLPGNYALNGDTLRNVLSGNTGNTVTKTWKAEARQDRSDQASFIIDQYSYVREENTPVYKMEDYTDPSTIVDTQGHEKMYILYEMVKVNGVWKYKVKVEYREDGVDYTGYNYYNLNDITVDEYQNIIVNSYKYTDEDGREHTTGPVHGEFAHRYVSDIYERDNNGNIVIENGKPKLLFREEEIVRGLKTANGTTYFVDTAVRVLKKTKTNGTEYYLYKKGTGEHSEKYELNYGGHIIYRSWSDIYCIDPSNDSAKTTMTVTVDDDEANAPVLAQAKLQELARFRNQSEHSIAWDNEENVTTCDDPSNIDSILDTMRDRNNAKISSLTSQLASLTTQKNDRQTELTQLQNELNDIQNQITDLTQQRDNYSPDIQEYQNLQGQINQKQAELNAKQNEINNKQAEIDNLTSQIAAIEHELAVRRIYKNKINAVKKKTIKDYADEEFSLDGATEAITVATKEQNVEIDVKLVYDTVENIYVLNPDNTIRYYEGTNTPIVQAEYTDQNGKVVWLDNKQQNVTVTLGSGTSSQTESREKYLSVSQNNNVYCTMPKSESAVFHHGEKVLKGFSQDVKTKTENINMPRYDSEGYEYFYKVYEDNIKTKDDAEYSKVEMITDETGTYRIITTDKGYKYESREIIENGNSIVTNTLIGDTYASTTKNFSGYFLPKNKPTIYPYPEHPFDSNNTYSLNISQPQDYAVKYIVYREGVALGTAYMYFHVEDNGSHFKIKDGYTGNTDGVQDVPIDAIVFAEYPQYERDENGKIKKKEDGTPIYQYEADGVTIKVKREPVIEWNCDILSIYKTADDLLSHSGRTWTVNTSWDNFEVYAGSYADEISSLIQRQVNDAEGVKNKAIAFPRYNENGALYIYDIREIGMYPITSWNQDGTPVISGTEAGFGSDNEILNVIDYEVGDGKGSNYAYSTFNDRIDNVTSGEYDHQTFRVYKEYRDENQELYRHNVKASLQYCIECEDGVAKWINLTSNDNQTDGSQSSLPAEFVVTKKERSFYYKFTKYPYDEFGTRIDENYTGTGGVKLYKGSLIPGSTQTPDAEGLGYYDPTSDQPSELIIDVYRRWLYSGTKKVAYDAAEVQAELGSEYNANATYYYNKDYDPIGNQNEKKFTTDITKAASEDRPYYKCADKKGNFRVVEKAVIDSNDTEQQVQHESRLLANSLLLYLKDHQQQIASDILTYKDSITAVGDFCRNNNINSATDRGTMENVINEFLNTHDDNSIIKWVKNHIPTEDDTNLSKTYADLVLPLKLVMSNYIESLPSEKQTAFANKYGSAIVWNYLTNEQFERIFDVYKEYLLDDFCEQHPEHHRGNSFVSTNDQNYDVSNMAELDYTVPEELKSPFEFALFNTRVGSQKMDIKMTWTDGNNQQGLRPDALKCMVTASYPVFADYTDEQMTAMGMERVQSVDDDGYEIWNLNGTNYYSHNGKYYDSDKRLIDNLLDGAVRVIDDTKATIMLTPEQSDTNNTAGVWTYSGTNSYLPKYTFANPSERNINPAESAETYGSKTDGTSVSYSVSAIGYYEKVNDKYIPWSSNIISYSGPSSEEDYPKVNLGQHHTGDVYHYSYLGAASGSVELIINKYWMDVNERDTARPEIHFDLYRAYVDNNNIRHVEQVKDGSLNMVFPPLNDSYIGVDDSKWWSTSLNMPKYTAEGYQIDYYAVEKENVEGSFEITGYDETENFVGTPTRFYVKQNGKAYYSIDYNNSETITIGDHTYPVQYYQCIEINGNTYRVTGNSVTIGNKTYTIKTDEHNFKYINYPTDDDQRYFLRKSSNLKIVDIDGIDYHGTENKVTYNNNEYAISYYIKVDGTSIPVNVDHNNVSLTNGTSLVVVNDLVRYTDGKYYQLDGDVNIDTDNDGTQEIYHLVRPTRRYIEINGQNYGLRDSTDDYSDQKDYSDILNYEDQSLLNHYCVIKEGSEPKSQNNLIKKNQSTVPTGYIKAAALEFKSNTGSYDTGTIVNRPIAKRTLDGNKVWKPESLPKFNSGIYEASMLPDMTLTIYRYKYDEIIAMRKHDMEIEAALGANPTEEEKADAEANMYLKSVKANGIDLPASARKYPKVVDSEHLVTIDQIKADKNGAPVNINNKMYSVIVKDNNGNEIGGVSDKYPAVTHEFVGEAAKQSFSWKFDFDENSFDKFDSRGKPYTYVLQEGYTTNIEVWRTPKSGDDNIRPERVYTGKLVGMTGGSSGIQTHSAGIHTLTTDFAMDNENYSYEVKLIEGTDALDESYTFAYDLEQSDDQLDITNLYNMDQSLSIKLKKLWKGLPQNLTQQEYPTTTFKLVRYLQDSNENKLDGKQGRKNTKEDVLFTTDDFNMQEYVSIGESKIFLENKQEVEINNYDVKYPIDIGGKHLEYNNMTKVRTDSQTNEKYVNIVGVRYNVKNGHVIVGSDVYDVVTYNGEEYIKIDVRATDVKKYVVVDNVNSYLGELNGENVAKFVINGVEYNYDSTNERLEYCDGLKVKNGTFTAVNGKITINGNKYAVSESNGTTYVTIDGEKYTLTSAGDNRYTADYVSIGNKDYLILTDAENLSYIKTGTECYRIVTGSGNNYVRIDVRVIDYDRYVSWNYGKYSLVDTDNKYYAKIGNDCYEIVGEGNTQHIEIPVTDVKVKVHDVYYRVDGDKVAIGDAEYSVSDGKAIIPIQSAKGYRYNYETDAQDNIVSVEVAYTGEAESEIELKWNNLPYYAPNMRPYIYDIEELGVTNGFSVSTLSDDGGRDYTNNENGQSGTLEASDVSADSTSDLGKNDYVTNLSLDPNNKKDKTTLNVGLSNNYESTTGAIKVQKLWENDTDYEVSPRPANLNVILYRTYYDTYVTVNNKSYPVERNQYIHLKDQNGVTHKFSVGSDFDGNNIIYYYIEIPQGTYKITVNGQERDINVKGKQYPVREGKIVLDRYVEYPANSGQLVFLQSETDENDKIRYYVIAEGVKCYVENGKVKIDQDYFGVQNLEIKVENFEQHIIVGNKNYIVDGDHLGYNEDTFLTSKMLGTFTFAGETYSTENKPYIVYDDKEYYVESEDPNDLWSKKFVEVDGVKYYVERSGYEDYVKIGSARCIVMYDKYFVVIGDNTYEVVEVENKAYVKIPVDKVPENITDDSANKIYHKTARPDDSQDVADMAVSKGTDPTNNQHEHTAVDMDETYPENSEEPTVEQPPVPFTLVGTYTGTEWSEDIIKNLPIYSPNGRRYYYYIVENEVPTGYTQTMYSKPVEAEKVENANDTTHLKVTQIQNTLIPTKAKAKKQWLASADEQWSDEDMLFASKLSGIAKSIKFRIAYSTTDYNEEGYDNAVWSEWKWLEGDSVEIDGKMYYPDTNPHENTETQYIRVDSDVIVKHDNYGDYIQVEKDGKKYYVENDKVEVGGVEYDVVDKSYIKVPQDIPVKVDIIDGNQLKYVEFSVDGVKKKYDVQVTLNAQNEETSAKVNIESTAYNVVTKKYVTVPYDAEVTRVNGTDWITFTVDGKPYRYRVTNNAVEIDGVTYSLQTKATNVKYIVIEHDTDVKTDAENKEYIEVYVDGILTSRELNRYNEVELNDVSYLANKRQYITDFTADVLSDDVLFMQNGAIKMGYTSGNGIHIDSTGYNIYPQKYVHILADVEVKTANNQKYVTYSHEGEYRTYFIDKHVEKMMELSQEEDQDGNLVAKFNDIEWGSAEGDKLPEYIRVDKTNENPNGTLKKVRYMPIEYSLSYNKTNYQDGSRTTAEYHRENSDSILNNLNNSVNDTDTFQMGFVNGKTQYLTSDDPDNPIENTSKTENTVGRMKLTIIKDWGDDFNRDDYRGDFTLDFKITRSNINYQGDTQEVIVTLTEKNAYEYGTPNENPNIWVRSYYVPITSNFNEHILSKYTVEELGPSNSMYTWDFNNYANYTSTNIYVESGNNATDVQHLVIDGKGRKSEVGSLDRQGREDITVGNATVDPVDRYAAFKNTKERLEFSLTPSKLWYNVNGDMYPDKDDNDAQKVMPEWAKDIFFPDGDPDKLRIRFRLQYQISEDGENADKDKWLYVTDENDDYPNAKADLAGIEPYLEFTVNDKGEITPVMHDKWDNLPKHYYTKKVKEHNNYLYRVQEVLVRNPKKEEVQNMYILLDGDDYLSKHTPLINGNGTWKITVPAPTQENPNATENKNVTVDTNTVNGSDYVRVKYDDDYYYAMARSSTVNQYNYVTKENNKYYIVVGTESVIPTSELEDKNEWYIKVGNDYLPVTVEDNELKVNGTAVEYEYINGFVRVEYDNNYYYVQKKFSDNNNDTYYYVFAKDGEYYVITDNGEMVAENEFSTRYQIVYDKSFINGDKVENVTIGDKKYYVSKTVKIGDDYYPIKNRMYFTDDHNYPVYIAKNENGYYLDDYYYNYAQVEVDQGVVTFDGNTYDIRYDGEYIEYNDEEYPVVNGSVYLYGSGLYSVTNEKVVVVGNDVCPVKTKKYYIDDDNNKHTIYDGQNGYYIIENGNRQDVIVSHGVVKIGNDIYYHVMYEDYITYRTVDYPVKSSEEIQTQNTVNKAKASVEKTWNDENNKYSTRPDSVMYEIQYRPQDESEEWKNVDENWLFDAYENSIENDNKLNGGIEYQTVSENKPYFKFDGQKYYVMTDIERKYVDIDGEKVYVGDDNKLTLKGKEQPYTVNGASVDLGQFNVQSPIDSGKDFIELNGQRIYVFEDTEDSNKKKVRVNEENIFEVGADYKVSVTLTVKTETYPADVKVRNSNQYYYTLDGADKSVANNQSYYIQATATEPTANVRRDTKNKVTVTKNGNDFEVSIYKADNTTIDKTVKAKTSEKVYIKVDLSDEKQVPKILIDKLPSADSQNRTLEYRFVESYLLYKGETAAQDVYVAMPSENSLYEKTESTTRDDETGDYPSDDTTVTNKIETVSVKVKKTWGKDDYNIAKSVKSVQFEIQRRVKNGTSYTDWETVNYVEESETKKCANDIEISWNTTVHSTESTYNTDKGWTGLPKYDKLNREYEYRAVEKSITPPGNAQAVEVKSKDGVSGVVGGFNYTSYHDRSRNSDGDVTSYNSVLTNAPVVSKLAVTKEWIDEHDRDNPRTDITLELTAKSKVNGEYVTVEVPNDRKTINVTNLYNVGRMSAEAKVGGNDGYYPDNFYYIWYDLPINDAQGNPILYTISETKNTNYGTQVRVTDYSSVDGNNSTYNDYEYLDRTDNKKKSVGENTMYILTEDLTKIPVTRSNEGKLTATINETQYTADSANMEMYIPIGDKRYFVMMDINSQKYVETGSTKVYVSNGKITLDGTEFNLNDDGTVATGSKQYNVSKGKITVNGQDIAVQTENETQYVIVNGQHFEVSNSQVNVTNLVLKSATVSPKIEFVDRDAEDDGRVYASTYLREFETTPDFKNSTFTGDNMDDAATYDKDGFEANSSNHDGEEYAQLNDITKIDFKDEYVPKKVRISVSKTWKGDGEVWKTSRPRQGVKYIIQYRIVGLTNETDWNDIPFNDSWNDTYGLSYTAERTVGKVPENATDEQLEAIDWNAEWNDLPIYQKDWVGVKFEYRVKEEGINYESGLNGLFNYAVTYGGDLDSGTLIPEVFTPDDEHSADQEFTESIYNSLRMLTFKKVVDPGYIGDLPENGTDIYHKQFNFTIKIKDVGVTSQDHVKVQKVSGTNTENITLVDGTANVTLGHNDEISVFNFHQGIQYEIIEDDYTSMGLKAYVQVDDNAEELMRKTVDGRVNKAGTLDSHIHSVVVTNRVLDIPATGGSGIKLFLEISLAFITMGAILGFMYWLAEKKKLEEQLA